MDSLVLPSMQKAELGGQIQNTLPNLEQRWEGELW
jgi:hypothetical protein